MTDVSGIPNMGFGGGGYFGGNAAAGLPAMSADQINASMWGRYSPQQAQHTLNNIYGPQGFGGQTAQHAALGAAYGRATGGFGTPGSNPGWQAPTPNVGGVDASKWNTMTPQEKLDHNRAVGNNEVSFNIGNVDAGKWSTMTPQEKFDHNNAVKRDQGIAPSPFKWADYSGGGIGGENARDQLAGLMAYPSGTVTRGPRLAPAGPGDPYFMNSNPAGFNPSLSGMGGIGSDAARTPPPGPSSPNFQDLWRHRIAPPQIDLPPSTVTVPSQQGNLNWYGGVPSATS